MSGDQAVKYGLIDTVLEQRSEMASREKGKTD
jgi:ATP-dependent protease ClpP protease subunit